MFSRGWKYNDIIWLITVLYIVLDDMVVIQDFWTVEWIYYCILGFALYFSSLSNFAYPLTNKCDE